jgi:elongation factor Ts
MAEITAALVGKLREMTGVGMMECKKALTEAGGNLEAAVDILRKTSKKKIDTLTTAGREAREGIIAQCVTPGGKVGVLVEINCQTDFVAKNESFRAFGNEVARRLATESSVDLKPLCDDQITRIRENIRISRHQRLDAGPNGMIAAYIHTGAKVGVLVEVGASKEATLAQEGFRQFVKDITLQVAAATPAAVSRENLDPALVAKEKEIATDQVKDKPPQAIAKIVEGKLEKFFAEMCLLEQPFIKDATGKTRIKDMVDGATAKMGERVVVKRFVRFQVGTD